MKLKGKIAKSIHSNGNFSVLGIEITDNPFKFRNPSGKVIASGDLITVSGNNLPKIGESLTFEGDFSKTKDNRYIFNVSKVSGVSGKANPIPLLMSVNGIGKATAEKIVYEIGQDAINKILSSPSYLNEIGLSRFQEDIELQFNEKISNDEIEKLMNFGLSEDTVSYIIKRAKKYVFEEFCENPYRFIHEDFFDITLCDNLALNQLGFTIDNPIRLEAIGKLVIKESTTSGDTYVAVKNIVNRFYKVSKVNDDSYIKSVLKSLADKKEIWISRNKQDGILYTGLVSMYQKEQFIAEKIKEMSLRSRNIDVTNAILKREASSGFSLAKSQKEAVDCCINNQFSILTGGPGTGKTFTVTSIIEAYETIFGGASVTCIAPTGRAAKRMTEQTKREANTIHSYLRMRPGNINSKVLVTSSVLIIDESSMLDVDVTAALFNSLSRDTNVILVGDVNQLPSVGAGNILSDLISSGVVPMTKLQVVYRQGEDSGININANKILYGNNRLIYGDDFEFIEVNDPKEAQKRILYEMAKSNSIYGMNESCILSPARKKKDTSVNVLNPLAQEYLNPHSDNKPEVKFGDKVFRLGDKVMVTKNSPKASNGDVGLIVDITADAIKVDLGYANPIIIEKDERKYLDLAYAMTVHKSQGSEYACVVMAIMDEHDNMLQKNLIYTGITRAKKKIVIIGQKSAIDKAISGKARERNTLLKNFLLR